MKRIAIAAVLAMAACAQTPATYRELDQMGRDYQRESTQTPPTPPDSTGRDTCGASRFQNLIGVPAEQIDRSTLPAGARVIRPDDMITMDFSALRLNIRVGADGRVASLECF